MIVDILLIFIGLCFFAGHYLSDKKKANNCKSMPLAKDYDNFYRFISDLDEWNDSAYEDYLQDCAEKGRIPIEKQTVDWKLENRKNSINDLMK